MYTFLVQKYGLKSLIVEWATAIINSIKFYLETNLSEDLLLCDPDVTLFAKILKNQIDENFHYVQNQVVQSLKQYTKESIREKWPLRSESDLARYLSDMMLGKTKMDEQVWRRVLQRLYPQGNQEISDRLETILNIRRQNLS